MNVMAKRGRGRPPLPPEKRRDRVCKITLTARELAALEAGAQAVGVPLATYCRRVVLHRLLLTREED